jgi:hypothetical protein
MTFVEPQPVGCSGAHCSAHFVRLMPAVSGNVVTAGGVAAVGVYRYSRTERTVTRRWLVVAKCSEKRVWTVSTPGASDSVVPASDWAGLGMFLGEWRIFRGSGWFESHLGHVFPLFRGLLASECGQFVVRGAPSGAFFIAGRLPPCLPRSTVRTSLPVHGRPWPGQHDATNIQCELLEYVVGGSPGSSCSALSGCSACSWCVRCRPT